MLKNILWFTNKYGKDDISAHSAQVSFFVMISFFPLLLFLLTLIQYTPLTEDVIINLTSRIMPSALNDMLNPWIKELFGKSSKTLISLSIVTTLWAGSKGFLGIISCIQKIYDIKEERKFYHVRILAIFYMIIFSVLIIVSMIVLVYGNQIILFIEYNFLKNTTSYNQLIYSRPIISLLLFILFFSLLYVFVPNRKLSFKSQLPGAFLASILWITYSYLYSLYIDNFANPTSLYGSLAYIVLFMLWLFGCANIIFIGALCNNFYENHTSIFNIQTKASSQDNNAQ